MYTDYELDDLLHPIYHSIDDVLKMLEKERLINLDKVDFLFSVKDLCNKDRISLEFRYIGNTVLETAEVFSASDMVIFHEVDEGKSPTEFYTLKNTYVNKLLESKSTIKDGVHISSFEESKIYIAHEEYCSADPNNPDHNKISSIFIENKDYILRVTDLFIIDKDVQILLDIIDIESLMRTKNNRIEELEKKLAHQEAAGLRNQQSNIYEKNLISSLLKGAGIAIAEYLWEMDINKQIKKGDMVKQVVSILEKIESKKLHKNFKISKDAAIDVWLREVAPDYAKKGGRPKKDDDKNIILHIKNP